MTRLPSAPEQLLAVQLEQAGIPFEREYRFHPSRKWRADFWILRPYGVATLPDILIEVEGGSFTGGHKRGKAYESDCDKQNAAMDLGFRVYRFTPAMVEDGRALTTIRAALGLATGKEGVA